MKKNAVILSALLICCLSLNANADLAAAMGCEKTDSEQCRMLLIGAIDAAMADERYCPDGKTSYGFIISAWQRDLKLHPLRASIGTYKSLLMTIEDLKRTCQK